MSFLNATTSVIKVYPESQGNGNNFILSNSQPSGSGIYLYIDTGGDPEGVAFLDQQPSVHTIKLRQMEVCDDNGQKYNMIVLGSDAWRV